MRRDLVPKSKLLSLVLRHDPAAVGVHLMPGGWIDVDELVAALRRAQTGLTAAELEEIVATNDKRRFELSADGRRIRAAQGHSLGVDLALPATTPPQYLFHGTALRHLPLIRASGLHAGRRDHVHLAAEAATARGVGARHGRPAVLTIDAAAMARAGHAFHVAANGVWLTRAVPAPFITFPEDLA